MKKFIKISALVSGGLYLLVLAFINPHYLPGYKGYDKNFNQFRESNGIPIIEEYFEPISSGSVRAGHWQIRPEYKDLFVHKYKIYRTKMGKIIEELDTYEIKDSLNRTHIIKIITLHHKDKIRFKNKYYIVEGKWGKDQPALTKTEADSVLKLWQTKSDQVNWNRLNHEHFVEMLEERIKRGERTAVVINSDTIRKGHLAALKSIQPQEIITQGFIESFEVNDDFDFLIEVTVE